ncbi:replication initiation protein [Fusobacterium ulcerans]|uniref:Initiator Rep protein domain-containing protein n=2 Tax=Fusobacterium ulcerans TaxID=861 RepID=S2KXY5_9FUSO|nr:replication initiation protein [Fusobacterium ulcerans]EPC08977.1 hypothetical protein HMPREF0402_04296 [Fusobacterium ulcerans 12-1B]
MECNIKELLDISKPNDPSSKKLKEKNQNLELLVLEKEDQSEKTNTILNQHSALVTYKVQKGEYYKVAVEKTIFALLLKAQNQLKKNYRENFIDVIKRVTSQDIDYFLKNLYKENIEIDMSKIKKTELSKVAFESTMLLVEDIKENTEDEAEQRELYKEIENLELAKIAYSQKMIENKNSSEEGNFLSEININDIFKEIRNYCKLKTIRKNINSKTINLTTLANSINTNSTVLKRELKKTVGTYLDFNYIKAKNLKTEVRTNMISSVRFTKKEKTTWFTYQIPREILELLLLPEVYVPLDEMVVDKIQGNYTLRMYSLLNDHIKRGEIELTREELFTFFCLPKSYENKTNLVKKFISPVLEEVEETSGIKTDVEFIPKHNWERIKFYPKKAKIIKPKSPAVIETIEDIYDNEKIKKQIEKTKRNIYVNKAWKKTTDNKLNKILNENGEEVVLEVLKAMYNGLKNEIKTTLVQYINGILKNLKDNKTENLQIFKTEESKTTFENSKKESTNIKETINSFEKSDILMAFEKLSEKEKATFENLALEMCSKETDIDKSFLLTMKRKSLTIYWNTLKPYLEKILINESN